MKTLLLTTTLLAQAQYLPDYQQRPYRDWNAEAETYYLEQQQRRERQRIDSLDYRVQDLEQQHRYDYRDQVLRDLFKRR